MTQILPAGPTDKPAIVALFNQQKAMWPWGGGVIWYRYWNSPGRTEQWIKAVIDGKLVGFAHYAMKLDNTRNLYDIIVDTSCQGKGVGRALVEHLGLPIACKTDAEGPSNLFYQALGFTKGETATTNDGKKFVTAYTKERPYVLPEGARITTFTGKVVNPLTLQPGDVDIVDIAHGLACVNRFGGMAVKPISVAQHSVYVSRLCQEISDDLAWQALFHDASEAYLGDVTHWIKKTDAFADYRRIEHEAQTTINIVFGCLARWETRMSGELMDPEVREADKLMVRFEARQAFGKGWMPWPGYEDPTDAELARIGKWAPWPWRAAEDGFRTQFRLLNGPERVAAAAKQMLAEMSGVQP